MSVLNDAPFVLVDGSSYLFRAYHALPKLTAPDGHPTGALLGVMNMLERLRFECAPTYMAVVFDAPGKTFRDDLYPQYKATRVETPDDIRRQIEPLHDLVRALGYPLLCVDGVEADDIIATLAVEAAADGQAVLISTGDKDLAQLVNDQITLVNTMSNTRLDRAGVIDKFGVPPERIVDYLALIGDTVDNVPGVDKVGPKTAVKWLNEFGDLDSIMAGANCVKGKVGENLRDALSHLPLSRELVTVRRDCEIGQAWYTLKLSEPDRDALSGLAQRFGLTRLLRSLNDSGDDSGADNGVGVEPSPPPSDGASTAASRAVDASHLVVRIVDSVAELDALIDVLDQAKSRGQLVAFDTETTALDPMQAELVGMSFAVDGDGGWYVPLAHRDSAGPGASTDVTIEQRRADGEKSHLADAVNAPAETLARLAPWLADEAAPKLGHHLKYDRTVLIENGLSFAGIAHDTLLESYLLDAGSHRHDLDSLAERHLGWRTIHYEDLCGRGAKQIAFADVPVSDASRYAVEDAAVTMRLHEKLAPRLAAQTGPLNVYESIERPLIAVLGDMERTGVRIDTDELARQGEALHKRLAEVEAEAYRVADGEFNLGSPKQIQDILFDRLGLPVLRKTPKGQPSTAEDVLEQMAADHPLPSLILEYRGLSKLISTYVDKLPTLVNPRTGRIHTSFQQAVAATGRLSSTDPNLQNIPIRTEEGRRIRRAFVAAPGKRLLSADYSQIELRLMAHFSQDEKLLEAFRAGCDIHRATAAEVFAKPLEAVDDADRRAAKAVNFGLIYGISAFGLARNLGIDQHEARIIMDRYFERYSGVARYMEEARERGRKQGYVETLMGRRLALPEIDSRNPARRAAAERVAINAPLQGTAADIIKRAMLRVHAELAGIAEDARMILQVHDELLFEVREDDVDAVRTFVVAAMESAAELDVKLVVEAGDGADWSAAH